MVILIIIIIIMTIIYRYIYIGKYLGKCIKAGGMKWRHEAASNNASWLNCSFLSLDLARL